MEHWQVRLGKTPRSVKLPGQIGNRETVSLSAVGTLHRRVASKNSVNEGMSYIGENITRCQHNSLPCVHWY